MRDGYRCIVTRVVDDATLDSFPDLFPPDVIARPTQCVHILAPSASQDISGANEGGPKVKGSLIVSLPLNPLIRYSIQYEYAGAAWAVMLRMGGVIVADELTGADIHRLENVMTMEIGAHSMFDSLGLWFEATASVYLLAMSPTLLTSAI